MYNCDDKQTHGAPSPFLSDCDGHKRSITIKFENFVNVGMYLTILVMEMENYCFLHIAYIPNTF